MDTQPENFQGRGTLVDLEHFDKYFAKQVRKESHPKKYFWVFSTRHP